MYFLTSKTYSALALLTSWWLFGGCSGGDDVEDEDQSPRVVEIRLDEAPAEAPESSPLGQNRPLLFDVVNRIETALESETVLGVLLVVGPFEGAFGIAQDLSSVLLPASERGKTVHCHFESTDNAGYSLLAERCDHISMAPAGLLNLVGPAAQVVYAKSLLDRVGITADLMQVGKYKDAAKPLTRDSMPKETRESLTGILSDFRASLEASLAKREAIEDAGELLDQGPFTPDAARNAGLIDDVAFLDEARTKLRIQSGNVPLKRLRLRNKSPQLGFRELLAAISGESNRATVAGPRLALVHLAGNITDGEVSSGKSGVSGPFSRALRRLRDDSEIRAIVLRIDSPGGSAMASDRMWHAVRAAAAKKPVVVSVGGMAASGGYYVASAATEIFAHDESVIGSIGVVGGKIHLSELASKVGVSPVILRTGERSAWLTPFQAFTDSERQAMQRMLQTTYRRFTKIVGLGRNLSPEEVEAAASGRIFSGRTARDHKLVDHRGSLRDALVRARTLGQLPDAAPIEVWPQERNPLESLGELLGGGPAEEARLQQLLVLARRAGVSPPAALTPLLLYREQVLATSPFALTIR